MRLLLRVLLISSVVAAIGIQSVAWKKPAKKNKATHEICDACQEIVGKITKEIPRLANFTSYQVKEFADHMCKTYLDKVESLQEMCLKMDAELLNPIYHILKSIAERADPTKFCAYFSVC